MSTSEMRTRRRKPKGPMTLVMGGRQSRGAVVLSALVVAAMALLLVPAVSGAIVPSFTWTGKNSSSSWSSTENWEGGTAPSGTVGTLTFPALTSPACTAKPPTATCYTSNNNVSGLEANALSIDDGVPYNISGDGLTLGAGGIVTSTSASDNSTLEAPVLDVPITLSAAQTWSVENHLFETGHLAIDANVSGATADTLGISGPGFLEINAAVEVGKVTVHGGGAVILGTLGGGAALNATDGNPVIIESFLSADHGSATGPLTVGEFGSIQIGDFSNSGTLAVSGGVAFGAHSTLFSYINQAGTVVGTDYSQLSASGAVNLGGTKLRLSEGETFGCEALTPGNVDTLITTTGSLTGTSTGVPDGTTIPLECFQAGTAPTVKINYTAHTVTATVETAGSGGKAHEEEEAAAKKHAEEEAAAKKHAEEEAAAKKHAEEEAAAKKHAEEEAAAKKHAEEEAKRKGEQEAKRRVEEEASRPAFGVRAGARLVLGTVLIREGGRFVSLPASGVVPVGSELDATNGRVVITVATATGGTQSAEVYGGRFKVTQDRSGETHFVLSLPLTGCPRVALPRGSVAAYGAGHRSGPRSRHLWVSETGGKWGTNGRFVSTSVEGTTWLTLDECTRSEVKVTAGKVKVRDLVRKTTKSVLAGRQYVANSSAQRHK
jgi:hypothetical protein